MMKSRAGGLLLEIVLAVTVTSIIAAGMATYAKVWVTTERTTTERGVMRLLREGLRQDFLTSYRIIASGYATGATWIPAAVTFSGLDASQSTYSGAGCLRRWWVDPLRGWSGWQQSGSTATPSSGISEARGMLISDLSEGCTENLAAPTTSAEFAAIWSQTGTPALVESPTLYIERLSYEEDFIPVWFPPAYYYANSYTALFQVNGQAAPITVSNTAVAQYYLIRGTWIGYRTVGNAVLGYAMVTRPVTFRPYRVPIQKWTESTTSVGGW